VARTVDHAVYAVRRDAFIDAAQVQITTRGYTRMSIQDLLDALDASRGAFYHYFDSKEALLEAVLDRMVHDAMARIAPVLDDPGIPAPEKLRLAFSGIAAYKADQRDLALAILEVWLSDQNTIVRERLRRRQAAALTAILEPVVAQGTREGVFDVAAPEHVASVLVALQQGAGDAASRLYLGRRDGTVTFDEVASTLDAYRIAFERILGAQPGSLTFVDEATLHLWFDDPAPIPNATPALPVTPALKET
jgi:AcrR family transcriptional regulator